MSVSFCIFTTFKYRYVLVRRVCHTMEEPTAVLPRGGYEYECYEH